MIKKSNILLNHERKLFTCKNPKNNFVIDYSNGYPVMLTTNVTEKTKWSDILKGDYEAAVEDGTPEHIYVNGVKYTYVDYKYATNILRISFAHNNYDCEITEYKSKLKRKSEEFFRRVL